MTDEIRILVLLCMFGLLAYNDIRKRDNHDFVFLGFGLVGAVLYVWDWQNVSRLVLLLMFISVTIAAIMWRLRLHGTGDLFAMFAATLIYPVYHGFVPVPITLMFVGVLLAAVTVPGYNFILNLNDWKNKGRPFEDIDEPKIKIFFAMFMVHRKRAKEHLTFLAQKTVDGKQKLMLGPKDPNQDFATKQHNGMYVEHIFPMLAYMFVAALLIFVPYLLNL